MVPITEELQLPFPHGVEIELQIVRQNGAWIRGEEIVDIFERLISNAKKNLDAKIESAEVESVKRKYQYSVQTEEGERGSRIVVAYENPEGKQQEYTIIGRDPNVTSLTWILEVATPPCTTLEELAWWIQTLIAVSYSSFPKNAKVVLISTGLNPTQEYVKNLSFGEHHHILGPNIDEKTKLAVYNMIRNFIPHFIALTVNSPFENKRPTDEVLIDAKGRTRAPKCIRSIRLYKNTTQLGPVSEFELIPYLTKLDEKFFAKHVKRSFARMVDLYPFTEYGTIELRVIDTQLSVPRRVGIALLIQALALKAKKMIYQGEKIPDVGAKTLAQNREAAIAAGLWASFYPSTSEASLFIRSYNHIVDDSGKITEKRNRRMGDAVVSMLFLIRDELEELGLIDNPFMQALLVSIFGSEFVPAKTTGADYQLDVYAKSDMNMVVLLKKLTDITRECCTNWLFDPLEGTPHLPTWLCWWKGLEPEIIVAKERVFAGQEAEFSVVLRNTTQNPMNNLTLTYTIEDSERRVVEHNVIPITRIEGGEIIEQRITFQTKKGVNAYNVIIQIGIAGKEINLSGTINTYWVNAAIRPRITTQFADGQTPVMFEGEIETNYPDRLTLDCTIAVLAPRKEQVVVESSREFVVSPEDVLLFSQEDLPPLVIPPTFSEKIERCALRLTVHDVNGNEHAVVVSKPFYVGFLTRRIEILLRVDAGAKLRPGEVVRGELELVARGAEKINDATLSVLFETQNGVKERIGEFHSNVLLSGTVGFRWQIPASLAQDDHPRIGKIKAILKKNEEIIAETETSPIKIIPVEVKISIDALHVPSVLRHNEKLKGWLRIRRNIEEGEAAQLQIVARYPDGTTQSILTEMLQPRKNLSLVFGPVSIAPPTSKNRQTIRIETKVIYNGIVQDFRSADVIFTKWETLQPVILAFEGIPKFVSPDEFVKGLVKISSDATKPLRGLLKIRLESVAGAETLSQKELIVEPIESKFVPLEFRVPVTAEMSTANLIATFEWNGKQSMGNMRFKIKAIEQKFFFASIVMYDDTGKEVVGLVPRTTPVVFKINLQAIRKGLGIVTCEFRIMSRRKVVESFRKTLDFSTQVETTFKIAWTTPVIDMVTGFYTDVKIFLRGHLLPSRAVQATLKRFTVY